MRHKRRGLIALLFVVPVLSGGCGGTSDSSPSATRTQRPPHQQAVTSANDQQAIAKLAKTYGPAYVEASKNLPDVVETR
jgi:hypothetical protein